jgi:hypothetical protein
MQRGILGVMPKEAAPEPKILQETITPSMPKSARQEAMPDVAAEATASEKGFGSPQEEIAYLREKVSHHESVAAHPHGLELGKNDFETARAHKKAVREYATEPSAEVLHQEYAMEEYESAGVALGLEAEAHDQQVDQLLLLAQQRGIKNALTVAQKLSSPHLEDDLHRILVQYVAEGMPTTGLRSSSEIWQALHMTLYQVSLASSKSREESDKAQELERLLGAMEQFYLGMLASIKADGGWLQGNKSKVFTVEVAVQEGSEEAVFYVAVPRKKKELFERHLLSIFPDALIEEQRNDYNIFNPEGETAVAVAHLERHGAYPLKVYKKFTHDPLNVVLSAFSKLQKHSEGAALQFVIGDDGGKANKQYKKIMDAIRKGESESVAIAKNNGFMSKTWVKAKEKMFGKKDDGVVDQTALDLIAQKAAKRVVPVSLRAVASAPTLPRAQDILENLTSTFNQFDEGQGNGIAWELLSGRRLHSALRNFTMRIFGNGLKIPLSIEELTTLYHLTGQAVSTSRELKQNKMSHKAAPIAVANGEGVLIGKNKHGGNDTPVHYAPLDRMRHFYEVGQTGTGKSFLMKQMIIQDIQNGEGCCYIDPHGSDIMDVLASVPKERHKDVIYFDPGHTATPMGLNFMEFDAEKPEQKTFVVNELFSIFMQLFGKKSPESMGPMFEQYFRNSAMLVLEGMEHGTATIGDISRVLSDTAFRHECLARSKNPVVNQFWNEVAEKAGGEASLENIVPYITAKTDLFMANEIMRPIIAQSKSAFNISDIMNNKKILLVNLSKGRIGDINAELLGLIFVSKILQSALSRVDIPEGERHPFYLYIDEFQNFTTPSIAIILSEARKYALSLNLAHQYIKQLDEPIRDAVFGNVGTKCVFRVSQEDAEFLAKEFEPTFTAGDIAGLSNRHALLSLLVDGSPVDPFDIETVMTTGEPDYTTLEALKQASYTTFGRPRAEVEAEIAERYAKKVVPQTPADPFAGMPGL